MKHIVETLTEPTELTVVNNNYLPIPGEIDLQGRAAYENAVARQLAEEAGVDPDYEAAWSECESIERDSDREC